MWSTGKVPNVYSSPENVEIGQQKHLFEKDRPMAFTGEELGKVGHTVNTMCGWNNGSEADARFSKRKIQQWWYTDLFEDLFSSQWTLCIRH